jgi:hypothetical protein
MKRLVEEVFVTEGVPQFTFVAPPNFTEILLDIRRLGKPVIIEGQSGTGKTTCVKKILERLGEEASTEYLTARDAVHVSSITCLADVPIAGTFVIDDFHRLPQELQKKIGDIAKVAAECGSSRTDLPKLVLIGINQIGSDLIQLVPDIAKRTGIHRIQPGTTTQIQELINAGCKELNISFENSDVILNESRGDYWLTQQLCQSVCALNGITETNTEHRTVGIDLSILRQRVVEKLKAAYYPAVKEFCRGQRFRPSNDPYYKLLRAVSEQESSIVDLNELANAKAEVYGSINNIKERRISILIMSKPMCARHFYYNSETKHFAIEDPALFYFLKHLDWTSLRSDCGFRESSKDYEFDFALSFAGENRDLARHIAESLVTLDASVFFDEHYEVNYLGKTWSKEFLRIFRSTSRLVVCLLDKHHKEKIWPTFERECFEPRMADAEVIPIFLDDTVFPVIPKDTIGFKYTWNPEDHTWQNEVIDKIVYKLLERIS